MNRMKKVMLLGSIILPNSFALADESFVVLGVGANVSPVYEGSKKYEIGPNIDASYAYITDDYGVFSLGIEGAGWGIGLTDHLTLASSLGYDFGRDEEIGMFGHKNKDLKGMGDLEGSPLVGLALSYDIDIYQFYISTTMATKDRHYGGRDLGRTMAVEFGANATYEINEKWELESNIATVWANKAYNQAYFGVSKQQAARSKFNEYDAGSGFKDINGGVRLNYKLDENFTLYTGVGAYYLLGDAGKSTLAESRTGFVGMTGISYHF